MCHVKKMLWSLLDLFLFVVRHHGVDNLLIVQELKDPIWGDHYYFVLLGQHELYHNWHNYILFMVGGWLPQTRPLNPRNSDSSPSLARCRASAIPSTDLSTPRTRLDMPIPSPLTCGFSLLLLVVMACGPLTDILRSTYCPFASPLLLCYRPRCNSITCSVKNSTQLLLILKNSYQYATNVSTYRMCSQKLYLTIVSGFSPHSSTCLSIQVMNFWQSQKPSVPKAHDHHKYQTNVPKSYCLCSEMWCMSLGWFCWDCSECNLSNIYTQKYLVLVKKLP